jgi:hypothetical protein
MKRAFHIKESKGTENMLKGKSVVFIVIFKKGKRRNKERSETSTKIHLVLSVRN